jgi:hypothetical protein
MTTEGAVLNMLLGAALVALGVLVTALADRVRGQRALRETVLRESVPRGKSTPTNIIQGVEYVARHRPTPAAPTKESPTSAVQPRSRADGGEDVVAALVAAGYKRQIAAEAAWACGATERATAEDWTRAALRRCARGVA